MVIQNPCGVYKRSINKNHRYVICDLCHLRVHIGCNFIPVPTYKEFKAQYDSTDDMLDNEKKRFLCSTCINDALPIKS